MKEKEFPQLSSVIVTLANINDKLREINAKLTKICDSPETDKIPAVIKHFVIIKQSGLSPNKKEKSQD